MDDVESITGIVFSEDRQKILLIKRRDVPVWVLPGGGVEKGENPENALIREIQEETNLTVKITRQIALYSKASFFTKKTLFYECALLEGSLTAGNPEVKEAFFFPLNALPKIIPPPYPEFIEDALKNTSPFERPLTSITPRLILKAIFSHPFLLIRFLLARLGLPINT